MNPFAAIAEEEINGFLYSTDKRRLNIDYIYTSLDNSYWAKGIPRSILETSIQNSVCIGIYTRERQIGFARVITDGSVFAWLADVFVEEQFQGRGISKRLMEFILAFDFVPMLRRFMLATRDAHGLYAQYNFQQPDRPDRLMEILQADIYLKK